MKTPPARRKKKDREAKDLCDSFKDALNKFCPIHGVSDDKCADKHRHICPEPQTKVEWKEVKVPVYIREPKFIYSLCYIVSIILAFLAGAAWQFPFWNKP